MDDFGKILNEIKDTCGCEPIYFSDYTKSGQQVQQEQSKGKTITELKAKLDRLVDIVLWRII